MNALAMIMKLRDLIDKHGDLDVYMSGTDTGPDEIHNIEFHKDDGYYPHADCFILTQ